jgi:hypothetical protein
MPTFWASPASLSMRTRRGDIEHAQWPHDTGATMPQPRRSLPHHVDCV